ncbi:hypothetical protein AB0E96_00595 [Kitasatospora sp. NPDC036755]|uniref:hypothetical protein n=1 Tax=Kitasatospora sp. NPDC036755 TaxID=3154600 RepID=UPI0033E593C9
MRLRLTRVVAAAAVASFSALVLSGSPAVAVQPQAGIGGPAPLGWLGDCSYVIGQNFAGGWCDGNGPDWWYQAWVHCDDGYYYGPARWAGDRRGSYAYCPDGHFVVNGEGGINTWHEG